MHRFRLGPRTVDLAAGRVEGDGVAADLTPTEVRLLRFLASRGGEVVPREELLDKVWGYAPTVRTRTIDTTTSRLRAKLEPDPAEPRFLHTLYGRGVRLDEVEPVDDVPAGFTTRFVGRRALVETLVGLIRRSRLTVVWGPAGAGKSRLVAEVSPRLVGAVWVGCGAVRDGRDLDVAVADALGMGAGSDLIRALAGLPGALVLDDCDIAADAVAERVTRWFAGATRLRVVATSRVQLPVPGAQVLEVGPLDPDEAVALFVDRARLRDAAFDAPQDAIADVVQRVDHLPLAIELTASQVHLLGWDALRAAPLAAVDDVVERSLARLTEPQRGVLRSAAVFEAPFDLADLAAVAGLGAEATLRHLDALVRQSFVWARDGRHRLYTLVRDRVRRDLAPDDDAYERHTRWFARLGAPEWIERVGQDAAARATSWGAAADLRAAWARAQASPSRGGVGLAWLWCCTRQGRTAEGIAAVQALGALPWTPRERIALGALAAGLWSGAGDEQAAVAAYREITDLASTPEEHVRVRCGCATSLGRLGRLAEARAELAAAAPHAERAANRAQYLGTLAFHTTPPDDEPRMREALAAARARSHPLVAIECLGVLGWIAHTRHADWDEARRTFLRVLEATGAHEAWVRHRMRAYVGLGELERARGDLDAAEGWLEQATSLAERYGFVAVADRARVELARTWNQAGRHEDALGLVEPLAAAARPPPHPPSGRVSVVAAEVRERLGEHAAARRLLERALGDGRADLAAEASDLLAVLDVDPARLVQADADDRPVLRVRRLAIAAWIADRRGEDAGAHAEAARAGIDRLGLLPGSEAAGWLARRGRG